MMGIQARDLMNVVIKPSLNAFGAFQDNVGQLLLGIAAQESQMGSYLKQIEGPALGVWQMEPATHRDIHQNFLVYRPELRSNIYMVCGMEDDNQIPPDSTMAFNLCYGCAMARVKLLRSKDPLPFFNDIAGQAIYWKNNYNSLAGKGDVAAYLNNYARFVKGYYDSISLVS
jgi:hypothetical protein